MLLTSKFWKTMLKHPQWVVSTCFFVVFLLSSVLVWHESGLLNTDYINSRKNNLESVAGALDRAQQRYLNGLLLLKHTAESALENPLFSAHLTPILQEFNRVRNQPNWQIDINNSTPMMPIIGIGDAEVSKLPGFSRDPDSLNNELIAALHFSFLLTLRGQEQDVNTRMYYISTNGFYITSEPMDEISTATSTFRHFSQQNYFLKALPANNSGQTPIWSRSYDDDAHNSTVITISVPIYTGNTFRGVLATDISTDILKQFLRVHVDDNEGKGELFLLDLNGNISAGSSENQNNPYWISEITKIRNLVLQKLKTEKEGYVQLNNHLVIYRQLPNTSGVLMSITSQGEGFSQRFGHFTTFLISVWLAFGCVLLLSHITIKRLLNNMLALQDTLRWQAENDPLTKLLNRRSFFAYAEKIWNRSKKESRTVSTLLLDLDHFKQVNDTYGHAMGDDVLRMISSVLRYTSRNEDLICRMGGEEFSLLLPDTQLDDALAIAYRIQTALAQRVLLTENKQAVTATVSIGVSEGPTGYSSFDKQLATADEYLYQAKDCGRNRIVSVRGVYQVK